MNSLLRLGKDFWQQSLLMKIMTEASYKNSLDHNLIGLSLIHLFMSIVSLYIFKSEIIAYGFIALLLITFGIPHGALDIFRIFSRKNKFFILAVYIAAVFLSFILFKFFPNVFFMLFFTLALVHFVDVELKNLKAKKSSFIDLAFASVFLMPRLYEKELQSIFTFLNAEAFLKIYIQILPICFVVGFALFAFNIYKNYLNSTLLNYTIASIIYILLAYFTNILITFFYFFNIIHAKRHMDLTFHTLLNFNLKFFVLFCFLLILSLVGLSFLLTNTESFYGLLLMSLVFLLSLTPAHFLLEISNKSD